MEASPRTEAPGRTGAARPRRASAGPTPSARASGAARTAIGAGCPDVCYGACVYRGALELAFAPGPRLTASSYENFFGVMLADFTGDGHADVLLTDHTGGDENHYWAGDGLGTFTLLDREAHGVGQEGTLRDAPGRHERGA